MRGQATKSAVGYLRPDFLARCKPLGGPDYKFQPQYGTDTGTVCTETDTKLVDDGRSSFPSGAWSFYAAFGCAPVCVLRPCRLRRALLCGWQC